jgi:hypothetical protein
MICPTWIWGTMEQWTGLWSCKRPIKGIPPNLEKGGNLLPILSLVY